MTYDYLDHMEKKIPRFRSIAENHFEKEYGEWNVEITLKNSRYILTAREVVEGTVHMLHYTDKGASSRNKGKYMSGPKTDGSIDSFTVKHEESIEI